MNISNLSIIKLKYLVPAGMFNSLHKKCLFFYLGLLFSFCSATSQNSNALKDSIKKYLYNNTQKSKRFNDSLFKLSQIEDNTENIRLSYALYAVMHDLEGNVDSTLYYYNKGLKLASEPIDIFQFKNSIAYVHESNQNYNRALETYKECLVIAKKEKLSSKVIVVNEAIENIKNKINQSVETIIFLEKKYKRERENDPEFKLIFTRKTLAEAYLQNNSTNKALDLIKEGLDDATLKNNIEFLYYYKSLEAQVYLQTQDYKLSLIKIHEAMQFANQLQNSIFLAKANFVLAQIKTKTKDNEEAIKILERILKNNELAIQNLHLKSYKLIAENYNVIDSFGLATINYQKYIEENTRLTDKEKTIIDNIHDVNLKGEVLQKQIQIKQKKFWIGAFILSILLGLILFLWHNRKKVQTQKLFDKLLVRIEELENKKHKLQLENVLDHLSSSNNLIEHKTSHEIKETKFKIDNAKIVEILEKMKQLEYDKYYLRQDCNLHNMAKALQTNTSYLSKIINTQLDKSFSSYINDLRVNYVILELKNNKKLRSYSVYAIAIELGYKNADSFSKYFKSTTGISPSVYIKKINSLIEA